MYATGTGDSNTLNLIGLEKQIKDSVPKFIKYERERQKS
jgi:hypothetical protein